MDSRRTSPRTKRSLQVAPDTNNTEIKEASGSRKRSKLANKKAGRGQQQQKKGKQDALMYLQSSSDNNSD
jgi:hypothetical protein